MREQGIMRTQNQTYLPMLLGILFLNICPVSSQTGIKTEKGKDVYFKFTINLPGKLKGSTVEGNYTIRCGRKLIAKGTFKLDGLVAKEDRIFKKIVANADSIDWREEGLEWRMKCTIYDAKLKKTLPCSSMNMSTFSAPVDGVGFQVTINEQGNVDINNKYYIDQ